MSAPTINGKTYEQLNSWERHALDRENPETFQAMREQSQRDERAFDAARDAAFHAGALTHEGIQGLRAQLDSGKLSFAQATNVINALPRPGGSAA